MASGCNNKLVDSNNFRVQNNNNFNGYEPKHLRRNIPFCGLRPPAGKVVYWDPRSSKQGYSRKPKVTVTVVSRRKPLNNSENVCDPNSSMKMPEQAVIPRKRPLQDINGRKVDDFKRPKILVSNSLGLRPAGKDSYGEKQKDTTNVVNPRKLSMKSTNVDSNLEKDTRVNSQSDENNKLKSCEPRELGRKTYLDSRPASKVKYWDPTSSKEVDSSKWTEATTIVSSKQLGRREKIKDAMSLFDEVYGRYHQQNRLKPNIEKIACWRFPLEVAKIVKRRLNWMDPEKVLGPVCGVQVGDKFKFRSQLQMVGLHCQPQCGIDYTNIQGKHLAISIVDSHRYSNESGSSDELIYCGHGGLRFFGCKKPPEDQKLERGNLALKNSMVEKTPIRVIRKVEEVGKNMVFLYDGLYIVNRWSQERSEEGKIVLKFELNRLPGQPSTLPNAQS